MTGPEEAAEAWLGGDRMMKGMTLFFAQCLLRAEGDAMGEPRQIRKFQKVKKARH
jgi:hypothetical protein